MASPDYGDSDGWDSDPSKVEIVTQQPYQLSSTQHAQHQDDFQASLTDEYDVKREISPAPSEEDQRPSTPPPSSYFVLSQDFVPDQKAPFEHEFSRYMSSQGVAPWSAEYTKQRTRAIIEEIKLYYSSQELADDPTLSEAEKEVAQRLQIYRGMCRAVNLPVHATEGGCIRALRTVLVNIVDYIDNVRTGQPVKVWGDFAAFKKYTLRKGKRIDRHEAKANGGFLAVLLRKLLGRNTHSGGRRARR